MGFNQNQGATDYAPFKVKHQQLTDILARTADITSNMDMVQPTENLKKLQEKVKNDSFKIQVVGTFKNGKSTFINSFLGEEILPAYTLPATAVINEVKYGEKKRAVLHFCQPMPKDARMTDIPSRAFDHMKKYNIDNIPPMEIPYDEIESYVVIPKGKDPKEAMKESPFEKVELFWPMELLKNGVEIIDSPGLNEAESRTKVTMEYLTKADAIIFLLTADRLCSQDEMNFVEYNLKGNGFESPFFVINKFDIPRKREREEIKDFAYGKLENYTTFGKSGFYFVSAINALDGKIGNAFHTVTDDAEFHFRVLGTAQATHDFLTTHLHAGNGRVVDRHDAVAGQNAHALRRALRNGLDDDQRVLQHVELDADALK